MMQTACGTPGYVAPEVLLAEGYDKEVDMWSIGVITYILLCGFPPFYSESVPEVFEQILHGEFDFPEEFWSDVSKDAKTFISRLLEVNPADRVTPQQALEHPWLAAIEPPPARPLKMSRMKGTVEARRKESQKFAVKDVEA